VHLVLFGTTQVTCWEDCLQDDHNVLSGKPYNTLLYLCTYSNM